MTPGRTFWNSAVLVFYLLTWPFLLLAAGIAAVLYVVQRFRSDPVSFDRVPGIDSATSFRSLFVVGGAVTVVLFVALSGLGALGSSDQPSASTGSQSGVGDDVGDVETTSVETASMGEMSVEEGLTIESGDDPDGDGDYSSFVLGVVADTREMDQYRFDIRINGEWAGKTVARDGGDVIRTSISFEEQLLEGFDERLLAVEVELAEPATNETVETWRIAVMYEPGAASTTSSSETPTGTDGGTPTESATPTETSTPSAAPADVVIASVHEDAQGSEYDNLNDEYVVITNRGGESADLGGWTLSDDDGHTFRFPDGFVLGGGEMVTVRTGSGSNTDTDLYWGQDAPVWNNGGDVVIHRDDSGGEVDRVEYD